MSDLSIRVKLASLWAALMFLYIYADFFMLFPQGHLEDMIAGKMGPFDVSQGTLLSAALLMALPALMVALTPLLPTPPCRWANVAMGVLYTLVNIGNLVGESWVFYLVYGVIEIVLTVSIVALAWRWRPSGAVRGRDAAP